MSLTYPEAVVVDAVQGGSELFPVSSLGDAMLVPALVGGRWAADLDVSAPESPYLAGSAVAFVEAFVAVRWVTRWFETRTLTPVRDLLPGLGRGCR